MRVPYYNCNKKYVNKKVTIMNNIFKKINKILNHSIMRLLLILPAAAVFAVLLNGCGIYSSYHHKDTVSTDSLFRNNGNIAAANNVANSNATASNTTVSNATASNATALNAESSSDTSSISSLTWREIFTDEKLQYWIEEGLKKNTDLNIAVLKVEEAEATLTKSRLQFFPSVSLSPDGQLSYNLSEGGSSKTYSLGASASWEIDAFGKLRNSKEQAKASVNERYAYKQAVRTKLIASIAENYYSLLMMDRKLLISKQTLKTWEENVNAMKSLMRAGQYTEAAVSQAVANKLSTEASVLSLEQQIHELENTFSTLIGIVPQSIKRGEFSDIKCPETLSAGVPLKMISIRPDVRQAEYSLQSAYYNTNTARSSFYPSITLSGSAGWTNSTGAAIVNPGQWIANAVGSLVQPLFNKGNNVANLRIAKAQQQEALLAYTQSVLNAGAEVNNALTQWQTARKKLVTDSLQIEALNSAVKSTKLLMKYGTVNYLEVLTAQQTLLQAQLSEVSDKYDEIEGVIKLYHALGGGTE